jgi:hypothetical protein
VQVIEGSQTDVPQQKVIAQGAVYRSCEAVRQQADAGDIPKALAAAQKLLPQKQLQVSA